MRPSLTLLLVLIAHIVPAQDFDAIIDRAEAIFAKGNYVDAALTYDSALKIDDDGAGPWYDAACAWTKAGNADKGVQYLRNAFDRGFDSFADAYYDRDLIGLKKLPAYKEFEKRYRPPNTIFLFDIVRALSERQVAYFSDQTVVLDEAALEEYTISDIDEQLGVSLLRAPGDTLLDFSTKELEFHNCAFENPRSFTNALRFISVGQLSFHSCRGNIGLRTMAVGHLLFYQSLGRGETADIKLVDVRQRGIFKMHAKGADLSMQNVWMNIQLPEGNMVEFGDGSTDDINDKIGLHFHPDHSTITFQNVRFEKDAADTSLAPFELVTDARRLVMRNVTFGHMTKLRSIVSEYVVIEDCELPELMDPFGLQFPGSSSLIPFRQFKDTRAVKINFFGESGFEVEGDNPEDFANEKFTDELTSFYKKLYDNYRSRADLNSANACYIRLKELEIAHLKAKQGKNLEEQMRLWLNLLMGFYTNHATSPGRGILVSFYIVIVFAIFYFFFPSEWDKDSKKALAHDFRIFIQENEHGYVRPFLRMMKGFALSFLNALTLSMNAFITLGFGNIPTVGVARYVCVLQGVLGWLLLSLFTVALLNQVLI